ncbi:hypothetical protein [Psychrobacter sp. Sarcosine-3u-12]|uniref:hypothetical protein n=1 Tax=Psychrobacter sp. Sarcosine-3u-12 TaxID=2058325 RepID=UPI000C33F534|nr:hypothetical protein [Psychrobacter sp. Sarcosine-3u-12]PKG34159.1 hypothetical protein CXF65_14350 [Psychrobacter sp. Sarcosine-3u-12]
MSNDFDYITVNKVLIQGGGIICLQSYENDDMHVMPPAAIKKVTLNNEYSYKTTLLTTNVTLADITVSSLGTIWAVDMMGHLYSSKSKLNGSNLYEKLETQAYALKWSYQRITEQTPACIIGEDSDLWIATFEGTLIHYDGQSFTSYAGIKRPIRFKEVNGDYFLMGYGCQLMQYENKQWHAMTFDLSITSDTPINDVTYANGQLLAVSNLGLILRQQSNNIFVIAMNMPDIPWFGCDTFKGAVYLAGGSKGAYMLPKSENNNLSEVTLIKQGYFVAVEALDSKVIFLQANTTSANFVCHLPSARREWFLVST